MTVKMNVSEYEALRAENTSRIQNITTLDNSILVVSGGLWLIAVSVSDSFVNGSLGIILRLVLLAITGILILIASLKSWENIRQIMTISSYLKVFYEYPSIIARNDVFGWESIQIKTNSFGNSNGKKPLPFFGFRLFFNGSYSILEVGTLACGLLIILNSDAFSCFQKCIIAMIYSLAMLVFIIIVFKRTFTNAFSTKEQKKLLITHVEVAIGLGVIERSNDSSREEQVMCIVNRIIEGSFFD